MPNANVLVDSAMAIRDVIESPARIFEQCSKIIPVFVSCCADHNFVSQAILQVDMHLPS